MTASPSPSWDAGLLPDQRTAAAHIGRHARLLAGPGTGKTWTLTKRILFLAQDRKVEPRRVVALTFTRAAAFELRSRIHDALAGKVADFPTVTTLHSYALRNLLHNAGRLDALPQPLRIADDWEERHIIEEDLKVLIRAAKITAVRDKLNALSADWDTLQVEGDPKMRTADPKFVGSWMEHRTIFGYTLRAELVYQLKRALEQRADVELVPPTAYLLVDEYQDLNVCDLAVIGAIRRRGAEVYGAGDDDQSIYGFRYAAPDGIRGFLMEYAPAEDLKLEVCLRCDKAIIHLATFIAKLDPRSLEKPLRPRDRAGEGEVLLLRFDNELDEANGIASMCRNLLDEKEHRPDDILILLRSDRNAAFSRPLADAFALAGVTVNLNLGGDTPLDTRQGRRFLAFLRLCQQVTDSLAWRTLLELRANGIGSGALGAIYNVARKRGVTFVQTIALTDTDVASIPTYGKRVAKERAAILAKLSALCPILNPSQEGAPPLADRLDEALAREVPEHEQRDILAKYLKAVITESDAVTLAELLQALSTAGSAPEQELVRGAVNVLTMHRAKGLSAQTVIVMAAEDEYLPGRQTGADEDDERRLLYVSLTRARQRLVVTFANQRVGQQRHTGRTSGKTRRTLTRYLRNAPVAPRDGNEYVRALGR